MTSPGRYRSEPSDIVEELNRLKRRVDSLEQNPRAGNTTIDTGTFRVRDSSGDVRVQVGILSDNTYGIEVKETGQDIFHQVPYVYADSVSQFEPTSSTSFTDLTTPGPSVTVPVRSSGRVFVAIFSQVQWPANAFLTTDVQGGYCSIIGSGANTISIGAAIPKILIANAYAWGLSGGISYSNSTTNSPSSATVFEDLNVGETTFTMKYSCITGSSTVVEYGRRTLVAVAL